MSVKSIPKFRFFHRKNGRFRKLPQRPCSRAVWAERKENLGSCSLVYTKTDCCCLIWPERLFKCPFTYTVAFSANKMLPHTSFTIHMAKQLTACQRVVMR